MSYDFGGTIQEDASLIKTFEEPNIDLRKSVLEEERHYNAETITDYSIIIANYKNDKLTDSKITKLKSKFIKDCDVTSEFWKYFNDKNLRNCSYYLKIGYKGFAKLKPVFVKRNDYYIKEDKLIYGKKNGVFLSKSKPYLLCLKRNNGKNINFTFKTISDAKKMANKYMIAEKIISAKISKRYVDKLESFKYDIEVSHFDYEVIGEQKNKPSKTPKSYRLEPINYYIALKVYSVGGYLYH